MIVFQQVRLRAAALSCLAFLFSLCSNGQSNSLKKHCAAKRLMV